MPPPPRPLRLAAIIPWRDNGRWIWERLPSERYQADLIFAAAEQGSRQERFTTPYAAEFVHLWRRRPRFDDYDVLFTWELRAALATRLLRAFRRQKRARWIALAPLLKGPALRILPIVRWALRDTDRIVCFTTAECESNARLLGLPADRFVFVPLASADMGNPVSADEPFVLALGHSGRDYRTLVDAVRGLDIPVTIVSLDGRWHEGLRLPVNVTVRHNVDFTETGRLLDTCAVKVIPLMDAEYASGQTVLLSAMLRGKPIVVTDTVGTRDYVQDSVTALMAPPGDADALQVALQTLWRNQDLQERLGARAAEVAQEKHTFPRFAERLCALADEVMQSERRAR